MTPLEQAREVLALDAEATAGPWSQDSDTGDDEETGQEWENPNGVVLDWEGGEVCESYENEPAPEFPTFSNALLIAHYRTSAPLLARRVLELEAEIARRDHCHVCGDCLVVLEDGRCESHGCIDDGEVDMDCECLWCKARTTKGGR
ncbi:MAG: hypothetical protein WC563_15125 [Brevundimonas sp.]